MSRGKLMSLLGALILVLIVGAGAAIAQEGPSPVFVQEIAFPATQVVSSDDLHIGAAQLEGFWTDERLEAAIPLDMVAPDEAVEAHRDAKGAYEIPFEAMPGTLPDNDAIEWAKALYPLEWLRLATSFEKPGAADLPTNKNVVAPPDTPADTRYQPYPPNYNRYLVNRFTAPATINFWFYPWSAVGRLYFQKPGDPNTYVCSASVFEQRALWTAGHCVYSPGSGWHGSMIFIPRYRNGIQPLGRWYVQKLSSTAGWVQDGNLAYDIGVVILKDKNRKTIASRTGALGTSWGGPVQRLWNHLAYPANAPLYDGRWLANCQGSLSATRSMDGPDPVGMGCDMLGGSSGGPWIYQYRPYYAPYGNYVNGVHSFHIGGRTEEIYAAYFGDAAKNLYYWAKTK